MTFNILSACIIIVAFMIVWIFPVPLPKRILRRAFASIDATGRGISRIEYLLRGELNHRQLTEGLEHVFYQKLKDHKSQEWIEEYISQLDGPPISNYEILRAARKALAHHLSSFRMDISRFVILCCKVENDEVAEVYADVLQTRKEEIDESTLQFFLQHGIHKSIREAAQGIKSAQEVSATM